MHPDFLILSATQSEISYLTDRFPGDSKRLTKSGLPIISGYIHDTSYDLMITGPGVFNAAHALTVYLEQISPSMILQTGIAGVFRQTGLHIGDVAIATRERYIHTGVERDGPEKDPLPFDLIKADPLSRKGIYLFEPDRIDFFRDRLSRALSCHEIKLTKGPFITVSAITSSFEQADRVYSVVSPVMEAMEGAASSHIAALYGIPFVEMRSASNFAGERDRAKWDIIRAAKQLGRVCACL